MIPDWFWDFDKQLNDIALDVALAALLAAGITESLRFLYETVLL
jgi:hypothetical protein